MPHTLADLTGRADGGRFALTVAQPTALLRGDDPQQAALPASPVRARNVAVSWSGTYRGKFWQGRTLVVDQTLSAYAQGVVLDAAWGAFDSVDMRLGIADHRSPLPGVPVSIYASKGAVVKS